MTTLARTALLAARLTAGPARTEAAPGPPSPLDALSESRPAAPVDNVPAWATP